CTARGPHLVVRAIPGASRGVHAVLVYERHALAIAHVDIELREQPGRGLGDVLGELGQDARRGFYDRLPDVFLRVEIVETVARVGAGRLPDLGRQLDARGTGADDH